MAEDAKRRSGGSSTWLWMILALVVVGGFMVWLNAASEPSAVTIVEDDGDAEGDDAAAGGGFVEVAKDTLAANKARFEGQRIQVAQVEATNALGGAMFLGELGDLENQVPILVRLDSTAAEGFQAEMGARYTVTGLLSPMSDSLAAVWDEQGEFTGEGERMLATFSDYFIQADQIRRSRAEPAGGGQGGAAADAAS